MIDVDEMKRLSRLIEQGIIAMVDQSRALAEAENAYRKAKGEAWVRLVGEDGPVPFKEAQVDAATADLRMARDLADYMRKAADLAVRSRQQQLSAWQTTARAEKAELELAGFGPQEGP